MGDEQQLATTPSVIHVNPDDVTSIPRTRTWVFGGTKSGKVVSAFWAYINELVAQEAQRNVQWSTLLGRPLTTDEISAVHDAARKLSSVTAMSYDDAAEYILGLMRSMRIVTVRMDYGTAEANVARAYCGGSPGTGPNYDAWWKGLEAVERRNQRAQAYTRMHRANTRGTYHYGAVKACSFWRHTRTR